MINVAAIRMQQFGVQFYQASLTAGDIEKLVGVAVDFLFAGRLVFYLLARAKDDWRRAALRKEYASSGAE